MDDDFLTIEQLSLPVSETAVPIATAIAVATLSAYSLFKTRNYRIAFYPYRNSGGGGLNFYRKTADGSSQRTFAIDYHPFWDPKTKQSEWKLHYHRGETSKERAQHRPYQGGW